MSKAVKNIFQRVPFQNAIKYNLEKNLVYQLAFYLKMLPAITIYVPYTLGISTRHTNNRTF